MINIDALPKPDVMQVLSYEDILEQNVADFKRLLPEYSTLESDEFKLLLESFAYRELHLRAEFNNLVSAFFLSSSTGNDLDNYAVFYGVSRLMGSKPYAEYQFSLSDVLEYDVLISAGLVLSDKNTEYKSRLLNDVIIPAGFLEAVGVLELQEEIATSEVTTEIITTPLPFVVDAASLAAFDKGSSVERDEELRTRILLSMADKSTAGAEETYKSFTFKADERIEDVVVVNGLKPLQSYVALFVGQDEAAILAALSQLFRDMATVKVFYYSSSADELMQSRIEEMCNKKEVRPLTDFVVVSEASEVHFSVEAELKILPDQESATVYSNAIQSLTEGLKSLKQIGTDITRSEINNFLKVDGVKEVVVMFPEATVVVEDSEIGVNDVNTITYTVI